MRSVLVLLVACATPLREPPITADDPTPCEVDEDCVISQHSSCLMAAYCTHADNMPPFPAVVCDPPEALPVQRDCVCESTCVLR